VQTVGMKTSWMDKKNLAVGAVSGRRLFGKSNRALLFRVLDTINQLSILCTRTCTPPHIKDPLGRSEYY